MQDGIGKKFQLQNRRGLVDWEALLGVNPFHRRKQKCSPEHACNPNFPKRTKSIGEYSYLKFDDMYRVNPKHRTTEEQARSLPMHRRLKMHFAENACKEAMERLGEFDKDLLDEMNE